MATVEIFKTNVFVDEEARHLVDELLTHFPQCKINFDLHDCDKILRVEGGRIESDKIMEVVHTYGYICQMLE